MTLDEAIQHAKDVVDEENSKLLKVGEEYVCSECAKEHDQLAGWLKELREYRVAEQGVSLKLPCEVNSIVYLVDKRFATSRRRVMQCYINEYKVDKFGCYAILSGCEPYYMLSRFTAVEIEDFGKTVFLTKEEAEQGLKRLESVK